VRFLGAAFVVIASLVDGMAEAQQVSATVTMQAERTQVAVGETFDLVVRADVQGADAGGLEPPDLSAFRVIGRRSSRPMQFTFGFGVQRQVVQSSSVYEFTLQAVNEGTFNLTPATIRVGGRTFSSSPITIVVGSGGGGAPQPGQVPPVEPPVGPLDGATFDPQAFLRTVVSPSNPYVGQQVTVTVYLYVGDPLRTAPQITREPAVDGFWVRDLLPPQRTLEAHQQAVQGRPFDVYVIRRFAAFPLRSGSLEVGSPAVDLELGGGMIDFFNPRPASQVRREGVAVPIQVRPLPEQGKPPGRIATGSFTLSARLDRTQVATGDAVTLTATVEGTGNPQDLHLELAPIDGLRILSPQLRDNVESPNDLVRGSRSFEWLVVPEREGTYAIGPFELPVFDPTTETYSTLRSETLRLVAAGNAIAPVEDDPVEEAEAVRRATAPDFGTVRTRSELDRPSAPVDRSLVYVLLLAVPFATWVGFVGFGWMRRRSARAKELGAKDNAVRTARKRLRGAQDYAQRGDANAFYGEIRKVLGEVLEARLGSPIGGYTHAELRRHLRERGMAEELSERVVDEIEGSEFARFSAAGASPQEIAKCADRVGMLIDQVERFAPSRAEAP
jgi:hypothetical protein